MPERFPRNQEEFITPSEESPAYQQGRVEDVELAHDMALAEDSFREQLAAMEAQLVAAKNPEEKKELQTQIDEQERMAEYAGGRLEMEAGWRALFRRRQEDTFKQRLEKTRQQQFAQRNYGAKYPPVSDEQLTRLNYISAIGSYVVPAERELLRDPDSTVGPMQSRKKELQQWRDYQSGKRKTRPLSLNEEKRGVQVEVWTDGETQQEIDMRDYLIRRAEQIQNERV